MTATRLVRTFGILTRTVQCHFRTQRRKRATMRGGMACLSVMCGLLIGFVPVEADASEGRHHVAIELVLAVDTSASVNDAEFQLQMRGIAKALRHPAIIDAILQHDDGVAIALVQWAGWAGRQDEPNWHLLRDHVSIARFATEIEQSTRSKVGHMTGVGRAIDHSVRLIERNQFTGRVRKIDVSGDGQSNVGTPAALARDRAMSKGIAINGLAILTDQPRLVDYYSNNVIGGAGAFVLSAESYEDFYEAMRLKLLRELTLLVTWRDAQLHPTAPQQDQSRHREP